MQALVFNSPPGFRRDFTCPALLRKHATWCTYFSCTRLLRSLVGHSIRLPLNSANHVRSKTMHVTYNTQPRLATLHAEIPMSKSQIPNKSQLSNVQNDYVSSLVIGAWSLLGHWSLVLGHSVSSSTRHGRVWAPPFSLATTKGI